MKAEDWMSLRDLDARLVEMNKGLRVSDQLELTHEQKSAILNLANQTTIGGVMTPRRYVDCLLEVMIVHQRRTA